MRIKDLKIRILEYTVVLFWSSVGLATVGPGTGDPYGQLTCKVYVNSQACPLCTGSGFILNDSTIVTADHVIRAIQSEGQDYLSIDCPGVETMIVGRDQIFRTHLAPGTEADPSIKRDDFAFLRVQPMRMKSQQLPFQPPVPLLPLARTLSEANDRFERSRSCIALGFGSPNELPGLSLSDIMTSSIPVIPEVRGPFNVIAIRYPHSIVPGDSGGPVICRDDHNQAHLLGVLSAGRISSQIVNQYPSLKPPSGSVLVQLREQAITTVLSWFGFRQGPNEGFGFLGLPNQESPVWQSAWNEGRDYKTRVNCSLRTRELGVYSSVNLYPQARGLWAARAWFNAQGYERSCTNRLCIETVLSADRQSIRLRIGNVEDPRAGQRIQTPREVTSELNFNDLRIEREFRTTDGHWLDFEVDEPVPGSSIALWRCEIKNID